MVKGTGAQAGQFSFWFQGKTEDDFIHSYPVVYSSGNHDQGGVYFDTYVYSLQDEEYGAEVEGDSSFNYAGLHIITMNSNPWGLFQMNSESTGQQADAATLQTIDNAMNWLKNDLATDEAKNAEFRLIMMHHPVSDAYTKRYIPSVIEPGKVDLLISGHTHSYARAVSSDPTVGAGTIYLTHQDARTYNKKGDFFYIDCVPGSGVMSVKNYGATAAGEGSKLANETLVATEKQQLAWSDISIEPGEVLYHGEVTVTATVTNTGKGLAAAVIPVEDNGETRYLYEFEDGIVTLDPGKSATLTGALRMESLGTHTLKLAGRTATVEVKYRPATFDYTNIRTLQGDGEVSDMDSNVLHIKADVVNIGNDAGTGAAEFKINGEVMGSKQYTLKSGESKTAEFSYTFDQAGEYEVTIGNAAPQTIYVEGSIQGMPIVKDKSGNGNNAYIHGQPEFGVDDQGKQTLILDGKRDYIEVPDHGGYTPEDAMTGMVWANLPSKGTTKGGVSELTEQYVDLDGKGAIPDHNPLMVKGAGAPRICSAWPSARPVKSPTAYACWTTTEISAGTTAARTPPASRRIPGYSIPAHSTLPPAATPMKTMYTVRTWISPRLKTRRSKPGAASRCMLASASRTPSKPSGIAACTTPCCRAQSLRYVFTPRKSPKQRTRRSVPTPPRQALPQAA